MQEKRVSVRTNMLGVNARISKDGRDWIDVTAKDISDGGMSFIAMAEFPIGTKLSLEGEASDLARTVDISCDATVVFFSPISEGKFLYGIKFMNLSHAHKMELSIFIEQMVTRYPMLLME
ncbi:MAG: PilZ domain-containing protein [Defluviitaleaceae bacterium]|nr:PilZ domain-containing protein [Defluviitaleaceae bacterium]